jgi:hypothetical protein
MYTSMYIVHVIDLVATPALVAVHIADHTIVDSIAADISDYSCQ